MNLTSRRLMTLSAAAGLLATFAVAQSEPTTWVKDTFEEVAVDSPIGEYKMTEGQGNVDDNSYLWVTMDGDASTIQEGGDGYMGPRSIVDEGHTTTKALKLETEGTLLKRILAYEGVPGDSSFEQVPIAIPVGVDDGVWIDTMIKFTPSEDDPEEFGDAKVAIWVNNQSNLVVRYRLEENGDPATAVFTEGAASVIDPEEWYRLTIEYKSPIVDGNDAYPCFSVYLNGEQLWHQNAFLIHEGGPAYPEEGGGVYFFSESSIAVVGPTLNEVVFQGTGWIDDLVVSEVHAPFGGDTGLMLTLVYDATVFNVAVGAGSVASESEIASGSALTFSVVDWYRFDSVTGEGITFSDGVISADGASRTATIQTRAATAQDGAPTSLNNHDVDTGKLITWAMNNNLSENDVATNAGDYLDDYLLNVAPGTDATLTITSIVVGNGDITVTVEASKGAVTFDNINGTLVVYSKDTLSDSWGEPTIETDFTVSANEGVATIVIEKGNGNFFKAVIK